MPSSPRMAPLLDEGALEDASALLHAETARQSEGLPPPWAQVLLDRIDQLEGELKAAKSAAPAFRPMAAPEGVRASKKGMFADVPVGGAMKDGISKQILVDSRGDKLTRGMLAQHPPPFEVGERVRINPAAVREGWPDGQTWGDVLARFNSDGVGVITKIYWLNDDGRWKVAARIRGISTARQSGDGFRDDELLPY